MFEKGYRQVFGVSDLSVDFRASGHNLLLVKYAGSDVKFWIKTPEDRPISIPVLTFSAHGQQRFIVPKDTVLRLSVEVAGAEAWIGKIYTDSAGDLL